MGVARRNQGEVTMPAEENVKQVRDWLAANHYVSAALKFRRTDVGGRFLLYTEAHVYSVVVTDTYLGCTATNRKPLIEEDWTRGNDLADGKFSHETFVKVLLDIVGYELSRAARVEGFCK